MGPKRMAGDVPAAVPAAVPAPVPPLGVFPPAFALHGPIRKDHAPGNQQRNERDTGARGAPGKTGIGGPCPSPGRIPASPPRPPKPLPPASPVAVVL